MADRFTPGKWRAHKERDGRYSIESEFGTVGEVMAENCDTPEQVEADANLISAAPEMHAALTVLLTQFRLVLDPSPGFTMAKAAIAKAEGRDQ